MLSRRINRRHQRSLANAKVDEGLVGRRHGRDGVRIGGRHFRIGSSEIARSPSPLCSLAAASSAGGGMTSTARQSTKTGARTTVLGVEERASSSKSAFVRAYVRAERSRRGEPGGEGVCEEHQRHREGCEGSTCQGETCHSLTPCHLHKQTYITGRQAASYVFPFMFPHARSHKPVSLVSRAAQSFTVAGSAPALTTVLLPAVESKSSCFPPPVVP